MSDQARYYAWFVAANIITLTFLTLLQLVEGWLFLLFLAVMHSGILLLIVSKKRFMGLDRSIKAFYDRVYLLLALYIPLLLYKLVSRLFSFSYNGDLASLATALITVVAVAGSIQNCSKLYGYLFRASVTH